MKKFLNIVIWCLFLFALFVISSYFLPHTAVVKRSAEIPAPPRTVFAQINDLNSWEKWSKWHQIDPEMKTDYIRHGVGAGSGVTWRSENKKVGNGSLTILNSVKYDSVTMEMSFIKSGIAQCIFLLKQTGEGTHLDWKFSFDTGYNPFNRWSGLLIDKFAGSDFEEGLENLATVCRVLTQQNACIVELAEREEIHYLSLQENAEFEQIPEKMTKMFGDIGSFILKEGVKTAGMPFAIYHSVQNERIELECGIPVVELPSDTVEFNSGTMSRKLCAFTDFYGDYSRLEKAHTTVQEWISKRRFNLAGPPMEVYVNKQDSPPTPEGRHTLIYYPVGE